MNTKHQITHGSVIRWIALAVVMINLTCYYALQRSWVWIAPEYIALAIMIVVTVTEKKYCWFQQPVLPKR